MNHQCSHRGGPDGEARERPTLRSMRQLHQEPRPRGSSRGRRRRARRAESCLCHVARSGVRCTCPRGALRVARGGAPARARRPGVARPRAARREGLGRVSGGRGRRRRLRGRGPAARHRGASPHAARVARAMAPRAWGVAERRRSFRIDGFCACARPVAAAGGACRGRRRRDDHRQRIVLRDREVGMFARSPGGSGACRSARAPCCPCTCPRSRPSSAALG